MGTMLALAKLEVLLFLAEGLPSNPGEPALGTQCADAGPGICIIIRLEEVKRRGTVQAQMSPKEAPRAQFPLEITEFWNSSL